MPHSAPPPLSSQHGMALTIALMLLSIMTLTLTLGWNAVMLAWQINHNHYRALQQQQAVEQGLRAADQRLRHSQGHPDCQLPWQSRQILLTRPLSWWHAPNSCHLQQDHITVDYYLSPLQQDPCTQVQTGEAAYWLLTAHTKTLIAQATVVLAMPAHDHCPDVPHPINHHWQSWQRLGSLND